MSYNKNKKKEPINKYIYKLFETNDVNKLKEYIEVYEKTIKKLNYNLQNKIINYYDLIDDILNYQYLNIAFINGNIEIIKFIFEKYSNNDKLYNSKYLYSTIKTENLELFK